MRSGASKATGPALNDAAVHSFRQVAGVQAATGVIELPMQISAAGYKAENLEVTAVDPDALRACLEFKTGGIFSSQSSSPQIVLGYGAQLRFKDGRTQQGSALEQVSSAEPTPPPVDWIGQSAQVSISSDVSDGKANSDDVPGTQERIYSGSITGILKEDKSDRNSKSFMGLAAAKKMLRENYEQAQPMGLSPDTYSQAYVFVKDMASVKAVEDVITGMGYTVTADVADLDGLLQEQALQKNAAGGHRSVQRGSLGSSGAVYIAGRRQGGA